MPGGLISRLRSSFFVLPLAAALALAMVIINEVSYQHATGSLNQQESHMTVRTTVQSLWRDLAQAESAQRGYLLTGREDYLQPFQHAIDQVHRSLAVLQGHLGDRHGSLVEQISQNAQAKLSEMQTTLQLYRDGPGDAWRELLLTNIGKEKMEAVRSLSDQLLMAESQDVRRERASLYRALRYNRLGIAGMVALSLLALTMYLRNSRALVRQREREHELIQRERDRLEVEVAARTARLKELAQHLQTVREDERSRLARELHDELGALLTAAKLDAARLKLRLGTMAPEVAERLAHLNEALNNGIALKRNIIENLRPSSLGNLGLVAALEILVRDFAAGDAIAVHKELQPVRLPASSELTIYRLVQEALTNISKHAKASEVRVTLGAHDGKVHVAVADNGIGFDAEQRPGPSHGLLGMRFRVDAEGGQFKLVTAPGAGTVVEAWLPQAPPKATASDDGTARELASSDG